jgi:hypothetical protein
MRFGAMPNYTMVVVQCAPPQQLADVAPAES